MSEYDTFMAMLVRAEISHEARYDHEPAGQTVLVESTGDDDESGWHLTEFAFDADGKLMTVVTNPGVIA